MPERSAIIKRIKSLPENELHEVSALLESLEERRGDKRRKGDVMARAIGICEGPSDLADKHDSYAY